MWQHPPASHSSLPHFLNEISMNNTTRRVFFMQVAAGTSVLAATQVMAQATALTELKPTDANAVALGYVAVANATTLPATKYPTYTTGRNCSNCAVYVAATGGCALFPGKKVAALGFCTAYAPGANAPKKPA